MRFAARSVPSLRSATGQRWWEERNFSDHSEGPPDLVSDSSDTEAGMERRPWRQRLAEDLPASQRDEQTVQFRKKIMERKAKRVASSSSSRKLSNAERNRRKKESEAVRARLKLQEEELRQRLKEERAKNAHPSVSLCDMPKKNDLSVDLVRAQGHMIILISKFLGRDKETRDEDLEREIIERNNLFMGVNLANTTGLAEAPPADNEQQRLRALGGRPSWATDLGRCTVCGSSNSGVTSCYRCRHLARPVLFADEEAIRSDAWRTGVRRDGSSSSTSWQNQGSGDFLSAYAGN
jgi:hypothetical protein